MNFKSPLPPDEQLAIYLTDHRSLIAGEMRLAERCRSSNIGTELGHDLTGHIGLIAVDRDLLEQIIEHCGGPSGRFKIGTAIVAEWFGRFKFNGQLVGYSPLSRVLELEALLEATSLRTRLWQTCAMLHEPTMHEFVSAAEERVECATTSTTTLEDHLVAARQLAFIAPRATTR